MREQHREGSDDFIGLNIWWNLNGLRGPFLTAGKLNSPPWPSAGVSQAYASSLSRYSDGDPESLRPRLYPRCAIGFADA